jgi:hypothetical protein
MRRCSALSARKTFADIFRGRDIKRGRFIVVKRTETDIVDASPAERYEVGDYLLDLRCRLYSFYGELINQIVCGFASF